MIRACVKCHAGLVQINVFSLLQKGFVSFDAASQGVMTSADLDLRNAVLHFFPVSVGCNTKLCHLTALVNLNKHVFQVGSRYLLC